MDASPILVIDMEGIAPRGSFSSGITRYEIGRQLQRYGAFGVVVNDEDRYWDDLVLSTSYVGP